MTQENLTTSNGINELENGQGEESSDSAQQDPNISVVGDASTVARPALRGTVERRWRRKNDVNSLPGLIREHSRLIAAMHSGRITLGMGEILSRAYGRHREMVAAAAQAEQLAALQAELQRLTGANGLLPIVTITDKDRNE